MRDAKRLVRLYTAKNKEIKARRNCAREVELFDNSPPT